MVSLHFMEKKNNISIGKYNTLQVVREVDFGIYLDGKNLGDILMPKKYIPNNTSIGDTINAFIYRDAEDRLIATTEKPYATVGEFAYLRVKAVSQHGAFLDWGLTKDLLVPYREQISRMQQDCSYIIYILLDNRSGRIIATEKFNNYLNNIAPRYEQGEAVNALIYKKTPLGYSAIINNIHTGIIYNSDIIHNISIGKHITAYVTKIREDDKIDLSLRPLGYSKVDTLRDIIIRRIREHGGSMSIGDKTDPETIKVLFGCSKKAFKMTIGTLYKEGIINISADGLQIL